MFKKVVAGGTFNKIHKGHEDLVKKVKFPKPKVSQLFSQSAFLLTGT